MVDFDLTSFDQEILSLAHAQSLIARRYARYYDIHEGEIVPDELPEAQDQPNVRAMAKERVAEASGPAVLDILLYLEEIWGTIPFRKSSNQAVFLGNKLVEVLGTAKQAQRWAGKLMAIALTEPDAGSDPSRIKSTAVLDEADGAWVLNGEKIFISLAHTCSAVVVFAKAATREGVSPGIFVIEKGTPGMTVTPHLQKLGQRSWDTANFVFTDCRLPADSRLTGNMKNMLTPFNVSRPWVAAVGLAYSRAALDLTREWLASVGEAPDYRLEADEPTWRADRFAGLEAMYEAAWLTLLHTKWIEDVRGADKVEAAVTKANAGTACRRIISECMAILGPDSVSEAHLLEMWLRDSRVCDIYEGAGEVNRLIIARDLLGYSPAQLA
jgi:acyl-CoA dehydrogenase